jgi:SpoVK/Ycf46/Vps4 family AAA+-type ATPase
MSLQRGINLRSLAEKTGQCSGAEVRGICTEAGMYALRERRQHVTQEDFEFAPVLPIGVEEEPGRKHVCQQAVLVVKLSVYTIFYHFSGFESGVRPSPGPT